MPSATTAVFPNGMNAASKISPRQLPLVIVGLRFGRYLIDRIRRGDEGAEVRIAAVCDRDGALARRTGAELGVPAFDSLEQVLADADLPAVGLFTPPGGRADLVRRCLISGKDVMTTKPFELDPRAAREVLEESVRLRRVVHVNSPSPAPADVVQIESWIRDYDLGRPVAARAEMLTSTQETADGTWYDDPRRCPLAPVFRLGIYAINDLVRLFGPASQVFAQGERVRTGRPTPDQGQLSVRFRQGGLASVFATFCCDNGDRYLNSLLLHCERGTIYRNLDPDMPWRPASGSTARLSLVMGDEASRRLVATKEVAPRSGEYPWNEFASAVRDRQPLEAAGISTIVEGVRVVAAMAESDRTGAPVDLDEKVPRAEDVLRPR